MAPSMDLIDLRCFVAVGEQSHFGRAAAVVGYTTSNVSHRIRRLERELAVPLFVRTSRSVRLTDSGRDLFELARAAVAAAANVQQRAKELALTARPRLTMAYCSFTASVAHEIVDSLRLTSRDTELTTVMLPHTLDVIDAVLDGTAQVGVTSWHDERLPAVALRAPAQWYLLVPEGHRLAGKEAVTLFDLDGEPVLSMERSQNEELHDLIRRFYAEHEIRPVFKERLITSAEVMTDFVATRQGVACSFTFAPDVLPEGLALLPVTGPLPPVNELNLVWNPNCHTALLQGVIDAVVPFA